MSQYTIFDYLENNSHDMAYNIRPQLGYTPDKSLSRSNIYIKYNQRIHLNNLISRSRYNITTFNSSFHTFYLEPTTKDTLISPLVHNNQYIYNSSIATYNNIQNNNIAIAPNYPIRRYINA